MNITFKNEKWDWNIPLLLFVKEKNYPREWSNFFENENVHKEIKLISELLQKSKSKTIIYPSIENVFNAFQLPLDKIKVVIIGQDPYHDGNATGLCFSVPLNTRINPSLKNIYTELKNEGFSFKENGDLSHWLKQGVMMLNTALTVEKSKPESHLEIWNNFMNLVLSKIENETVDTVWLLMGAKAITFSKYVNTSKGHKSFCTSHPSPFSASKSFRNISAFLGSNVFKKINDFLIQKGKKIICW